MSFILSSPIFTNGAAIPKKYTCDGDDMSPPLDILGASEGAQSFALIVDDPDAPKGTWTHWVLFNIPADTTHITEGVEGLGVSGNNSWPKKGYGGPCPPSGEHRYVFTLYALDTTLDLPEGAIKAEVHKAMDGHILDTAELTGLYARLTP